MFDTVDKKKSLIDSKRPLLDNTLKSIREELMLQLNYNSNAIEGNTLTLKETKVVLEGITIGGKLIREHLEIINHRDAFGYIEEIIKDKEVLTEWQIKNIHRLVLKEIDNKNAGIYRKENVLISGAKHIPPDFATLNSEMERFIHWYDENKSKLHPIELASMIHILFVKIHPFIDGNGRTSRLLLNMELLKQGYPIVIIKNEHRAEYYNALDKAHTEEKYDDFIKIIEKAVDESLELYIKILNSPLTPL